MNYLAKPKNEQEWNYIGIDVDPPKGTKLQLLTLAGIAVLGEYQEGAGYVAWAPLLTIDKIKFKAACELLAEQRNLKA